MFTPLSSSASSPTPIARLSPDPLSSLPLTKGDIALMLQGIGETETQTILNAPPARLRKAKVTVEKAEEVKKGPEPGTGPVAEERAKACFYSMLELTEIPKPTSCNLRVRRLQHIAPSPVSPYCIREKCENLEEVKVSYIKKLAQLIDYFKEDNLRVLIEDGLKTNCLFSSLGLPPACLLLLENSEPFQIDYASTQKRVQNVMINTPSDSPTNEEIEQEFEAFFPATFEIFTTLHGASYARRFSKYPLPEVGDATIGQAFTDFRRNCKMIWTDKTLYSSEKKNDTSPPRTRYQEYRALISQSKVKADNWLMGRWKETKRPENIFLQIWVLLIESTLNNIDTKKSDIHSTIRSMTIELISRNQLFFSNCSQLKAIEDVRILTDILDEQNQHSLARFHDLIIIYGSFVRFLLRSKILLAPDDPITQKKIIDSCMEYIQYARQEASSSKEEASDAKNDEMILHNHHSHKIMGCEEGLDTRKQKIKGVWVLNHLSHCNVKNFQHAHTLPFPSLFNWNLDKGILSCPYTGHHISQTFINELRESGISASMDERVSQQIQSIAATYNGMEDKIHCFLHIMKDIYLVLLSETELTPDFINSEFDQMSEWHHGLTNYKQSLADALLSLIQQEQHSTEQVIQVLMPYIENSFNEIHNNIRTIKLSENLASNKQRLVMQIGIIQVHQAMSSAIIQNVQREMRHS